MAERSRDTLASSGSMGDITNLEARKNTAAGERGSCSGGTKVSFAECIGPRDNVVNSRTCAFTAELELGNLLRCLGRMA